MPPYPEAVPLGLRPLWLRSGCYPRLQAGKRKPPIQQPHSPSPALACFACLLWLREDKPANRDAGHPHARSPRATSWETLQTQQALPGSGAGKRLSSFLRSHLALQLPRWRGEPAPRPEIHLPRSPRRSRKQPLPKRGFAGSFLTAPDDGETPTPTPRTSDPRRESPKFSTPALSGCKKALPYFAPLQASYTPHGAVREGAKRFPGTISRGQDSSPPHTHTHTLSPHPQAPL